MSAATYDEQRTVAIGALLEIAQDHGVRAGLRIHAARSVLLAGIEPDMDVHDDEPTPTADETTEDLIDQIAERAADRVLAALDARGS